jgi:hypothetical protein
MMAPVNPNLYTGWLAASMNPASYGSLVTGLANPATYTAPVAAAATPWTVPAVDLSAWTQMFQIPGVTAPAAAPAPAAK